ncbi:hypothetical protein ARAF_0417 [Arsenophonus endosymbiont of Aleurodicus floccissimus]|uniref:hypothetical protein n=1 Tax=Arsenophonus endosymbiont of Aleurodicus floccissimus TaxID=2152761 RepID=UPI000E6B1430|nr:hypothetical protein [Arsenophonus endosymbiont of Aleurodicus floccissimus]SPP31298.1 hypothetical protein ARAF_0417 [Arsenophonus endosymbiont of Aleurodicus floccissimus]
MDEGDLKPIKEWPKVWRTTLNGLDIMAISSAEDITEALFKKIRWPAKIKNLELLGKHGSVMAFKEQIAQKIEASCNHYASPGM